MSYYDDDWNEEDYEEIWSEWHFCGCNETEVELFPDNWDGEDCFICWDCKFGMELDDTLLLVLLKWRRNHLDDVVDCSEFWKEMEDEN